MDLPFKMITETEIEQYRQNSFWDKEPETIEWIKSFQPGDVFYDVGANIGIYSLYCAAINPEVSVSSFEPMKANFNRLVENIILNDFGHIILPYQFVMGEDRGRIDFEYKDHKIGSSGGQMSEIVESGCEICRSIDSLVFFEFNFPSPNHIKIDIDGQEHRVVRGMLQTIKSSGVKSILIELDLNNERIDETKELITKAGFTADNRFNKLPNHSSIRRKKENIQVENIIYTR